MVDVIEVFDVVKNVKFQEFIYLQEMDAELPAFKLKEPTTEEWNRKARIQNTKMFVETFNRNPLNYDEVLSWVYSFIPERKESQPTANELTFA